MRTGKAVKGKPHTAHAKILSRPPGWMRGWMDEGTLIVYSKLGGGGNVGDESFERSFSVADVV